MKPAASGFTPTTAPFFAVGITIRFSTATGEATNRSVLL
jgi:hypothetical protein